MINNINLNIDDLKDRLATLYDDLNLTLDQAKKMVELIDITSDDKKSIIQDMYFRDNSPIKVINTEFTCKGEGDITGEMIDLSVHYDEYIQKMNKEVDELMKRHELALKILNGILEMEGNKSYILYLRYYKRLSTEEVWNKLYISKTSYFRIHNDALRELKKILSDDGSDDSSAQMSVVRK